ncbi:MAG: hypothetical protein L7F78_07770, partial [Syntrophales bacterium LBB04]|nr:hypothetical protein [Syntrophales bacterium LBB04]
MEGDCTPPPHAPHSSPSTGRGILRGIHKLEKVRFSIGGKTFEHGAFDKRKCLSAPCGACFVLCPAGDDKKG